MSSSRHTAAANARCYIDDLPCVKGPGPEEGKPNQRDHASFGIRRYPASFAGLARVRAGRRPLVPWGGSDVVGQRSRSSTCQPSSSLNSDLAHLVSWRHSMYTRQDTSGYFTTVCQLPT